jgi:hypothetical protein
MNHCCEAFPTLIDTFDWFKEVDRPVWAMPTIQGTKIRVNWCPSCGTEVRGIEINVDRVRLS